MSIAPVLEIMTQEGEDDHRKHQLSKNIALGWTELAVEILRAMHEPWVPLVAM